MSLQPAFKHISPGQLAGIIKARPAGALAEFAVVDVRDSDFVGGNIVQALNYPSERFHDSVAGLVDRLKDVPQVVFHCALSQARGPKAARIYAETRSLVVPEAERERAAQEIFVLRGGFADFQAKYRDDPELVEKFNKYYHD
ncbi:Cdc25 phosphatase Ibp1 [Cryptotrichosporon argae]